ncbi:hypothetical protein HS088_TW03G00829 [Tripterygium wilfordii]|uniref:BZIP domain-containing protein n=1 Tax=Tripterygium wilfordii TaxID=458696 RepID=A0A7J7DVU4_TRIWF|nr:uncharacterized protein LOC119991122 [Tripterygium wilfordii]KAF5750492.1 hypothetical protein HS088_TW03G00829 [Tripterygium wilfordii]
MRLDLERCCVSSSCSSPCSSAEEEAVGVSADRLVMSELEAAEALADFAHLVNRESGGESGGQWGSKGKRVRKRVASESPPCDLGLNPIDSVRCCSDLGQDRVNQEQRESQTICKNLMENTLKSEQYEESLKPSLTCFRSHASYGGSRGRQLLTEDEKEARRLRRVLANRESARQTIRRRQALCEELTTKVADLSWENENLIKEKELALKEYQYLETTNKKLKAKMAKMVKVELDETKGEPKSADVQMPKPPTTEPPFLLYNQHPFQPLSWPSIPQFSNPFLSPSVAPSNIPLPAIEKLGSSRPENSMNLNGPGTPIYILPCPWFFPMPDHGNGVHPQPSCVFKNVHDKTAVDNCCSASSSSEIILHAQNHLSSFPIKLKSEPSHSTKARFTADLNEIPPELPAEGGDQHTGPQANKIILPTRVLSALGQTLTVEHENATHSQQVASSISTKATDIVSSLTENSRDRVNYSTKKLADTVAAAEARKRRKELTKLKNLHGRQCRMNC